MDATTMVSKRLVVLLAPSVRHPCTRRSMRSKYLAGLRERKHNANFVMRIDIGRRFGEGVIAFFLTQGNSIDKRKVVKLQSSLGLKSAWSFFFQMWLAKKNYKQQLACEKKIAGYEY